MKHLYLTLFILTGFVSYSQNPLMIPPTLTGPNINLNLQSGTVGFFPGPLTNTFGINGNILGPTLILEADSFVNITVNNNLADTTTMHWHGMHVSPENDGGPHTIILPGTTWNPSFTVMDKAATYWYHPHLHMKTDQHVVKGMAGMIIVKDAEEAALNLPRTYGVDDFPMVLQTKFFDASNQIIVDSHVDSTFMINATIDPYLDAPAQIVRFRLLNGSSNRTYLMGFSNNMPFYQIASDGGLLAAPDTLTRLRLAPGERAEILVDLNGMQSQSVDLVNYCEELPIGLYGAEYPAMNQTATLPGYGSNPLNLYNYTMLQINVVAPTGSPVTVIPATLATVTPLLEINANQARTITFGVGNIGPNFLLGPFLFDGGSFDIDTIDQYVPLNNIEVWSLTNNTQTHHPFHIHDVQFYILDIDGNVPPLNEQGRKDVVLVAPFETVRFIAQFSDFESDTVPYMYHCHMLPHEDGGMMGQFVVSSTINVPTIEASTGKNTFVYPNPTNNIINVELPSTLQIANAQFILSDVNGKIISEENITNHITQYDLSKHPKGIYFYQLINDRKTYTGKIVVQ